LLFLEDADGRRAAELTNGTTTEIAGKIKAAKSPPGQLLGSRGAERAPGYFLVFGQPVTLVRPGPVGSAPGIHLPVCHVGDFSKQIDQNA